MPAELPGGGLLLPGPYAGRQNCGVGATNFDADASLASEASAHVNDTAFLFGLITHVGQKQALTARDNCLKRERTAVLVSVNGFGFFVERLLVRVRAVGSAGVRCAHGADLRGGPYRRARDHSLDQGQVHDLACGTAVAPPASTHPRCGSMSSPEYSLNFACRQQ